MRTTAPGSFFSAIACSTTGGIASRRVRSMPEGAGREARCADEDATSSGRKTSASTTRRRDVDVTPWIILFGMLRPAARGVALLALLALAPAIAAAQGRVTGTVKDSSDRP